MRKHPLVPLYGGIPPSYDDVKYTAVVGALCSLILGPMHGDYDCGVRGI